MRVSSSTSARAEIHIGDRDLWRALTRYKVIIWFAVDYRHVDGMSIAPM